MSLDPSGFPIVGPGTPYINPSILVAAPTGVEFGTIPTLRPTPDQMFAEQYNICVRATAMVEEYCNQPLRATIDVEDVYGPGDFRCQNQPNGNTRMLMSRFPVTQVLGAQVSAANAFPPSYSTVAANQMRPEVTLLGVYGTTAPGASASGGQAILLAPGSVNWCFGRLSTLVTVTYMNGWPHGSLTAAATAGSSSLAIDDITGWLGAVGTVFGGAQQETILATVVTPTTSGAISGPGTLTLQSPLSFDHQVGDIVSCLPGAVQQATILYACAQALVRGATSTAVQSLGGGVNSGGPLDSPSLEAAAQRLIHPYSRRI